MTNTVVAIFDNPNHAHNAVQQLIDTGISRSEIDIALPYDRATTTQVDVSDEDGFFNRIGRFFSSLFEDQTQAEKYAEMGRRNTIITVHADTPEAAAVAAHILDEHGAIDAEPSTMPIDNTRISDNTFPINDDRIDGATTIGAGGLRTRSRIFNRPIEKDFRLFSDAGVHRQSE